MDMFGRFIEEAKLCFWFSHSEQQLVSTNIYFQLPDHKAISIQSRGKTLLNWMRASCELRNLNCKGFIVVFQSDSYPSAMAMGSKLLQYQALHVPATCLRYMVFSGAHPICRLPSLLQAFFLSTEFGHSMSSFQFKIFPRIKVWCSWLSNLL